MATLMQKDVLIEMAATTRGIIFHSEKFTEQERDDDTQIVLSKLEKFYGTSENQLNYEEELAELKEIKAKYEYEIEAY